MEQCQQFCVVFLHLGFAFFQLIKLGTNVFFNKQPITLNIGLLLEVM